ncbi:MAG: hydrogenase maturation protease [Anaeromyxobacter sp.]
MARIAVIGIGNVLTADDGVGPYVLKTLEAGWTFPEDVQLLDAGTPGLDLTAYMADLEAVVFVDAVKASAPPGTLRLYDRDGLVKKSPVLAVSPHEPGVREAIMNAEFMGVAPKVIRLVGVVPGSTGYEMGLTDAVRAAVPAAVAQVLEELRALGVQPQPRVPPLEPDLWWERKPGA